MAVSVHLYSVDSSKHAPSKYVKDPPGEILPAGLWLENVLASTVYRVQLKTLHAVLFSVCGKIVTGKKELVFLNYNLPVDSYRVMRKEGSIYKEGTSEKIQQNKLQN